MTAADLPPPASAAASRGRTRGDAGAFARGAAGPIAALLFLAFFALHLAGGFRLEIDSLFERNDVLVGADTQRAFADLAGTRQDDHEAGSKAHPAFVLLHQPLGRALVYAFERAGLEQPHARRRAALSLTAAAGALAVSLVFLLLRRLGIGPARAALFAGVFGASTSQWLFASIPETWIFSGLGVTALALVAAGPREPEWKFQLAAVYALSTLATHVVPVGLFAVVRHGIRSRRAWLRVVGSVALAGGIATGLAIAQAAIYPKSRLFLRASSLSREEGWVRWRRWTEEPARTAEILLEHMWVANVVAPEPTLTQRRRGPMAQIDDGEWGRSASRAGVLAGWAAILALAATGAAQRRFYTPWCLAALAYLAYNFAFYSLFGSDRALYSCCWTAITVAVVASGFEVGVRRGARLERAASLLLVLFLAWQLASNWRFLGELRALTSG